MNLRALWRRLRGIDETCHFCAQPFTYWVNGYRACDRHIDAIKHYSWRYLRASGSAGGIAAIYLEDG